MRFYSSFFAAAILALVITGCSGVSTPTDSSASGTRAGMDHSTMNMESSTASDVMFIDRMISHHQGAMGMAQMALGQAEHEEIRTLAEAVITAQETEIKEMQGWLLDWYQISQ